VFQPKERAPKKEGGKGGNNRPRNNDRESNSGTYDGSDKPQKPADGEGRKGGRRREEEGGGRKGGNRKGGKGEQRFDRRDQSGKGRGKGEAREGRGKYNWGDKTDGADEAPKEATEGAEAAAEGPVEPAPEPEPEEVTMSLQEYMKAQKEAKESTLPKLNERKIDDDGSGFKVVRKEFEGADDVVFRQYDGKKKNRDAKEVREFNDTVLNIKFVENVLDEPAPKGGGKGGDRDGGRKGGGKGDRDGGRKGGGKGDGKPAQKPQQSRAPKSGGFSADLSNNDAFPTLG
jgi:hypothetical protein